MSKCLLKLSAGGATTVADLPMMVLGNVPFDDTIIEIFDRRSLFNELGYDPHRFVELYGGEMVEPLPNPPDPATNRSDFYYNTTQNILYKRIFQTNDPGNGIIIAYWKPITDSYCSM